MIAVELKNVDTSALVAELKRRMSEIEQARQELFGASSVSVPRGRPKGKTAKAGRTGSTAVAAAQINRRYWEAKKKGDTERMNKHLAKLKSLGKEPWKS